MKRVYVTIRIPVKSDTRDPEQFYADTQEVLEEIIESGDLKDYSEIDEDSEEELDEDSED